MLGTHAVSRGGGRGWARPFFPLVLFAAAACAGAGSGPPLPERETTTPRAAARVPEWAGRPLSWRKLEAIAHWQEA